MDVATHLLVPYAAALVALGFWRRGGPTDRRKAAVAAVFGIAGAAPDLDGLLDGLSEWSDSLYWMQHRGVSHAAIGAPLFALGAMGLLVLAARLWPRRMGLFAWRPVLVPAAILGSYTHLLLDGVTYGGVPLWWPFAYGRVSFVLYHWLVFWTLPIGGLALLLHAIGKLSRRWVIVSGAVVVALLLVVGGVRLWTRPDAQEGELVYSTRSDREWVVIRQLENGTWEAQRALGDERRDPMWFREDVPAEAAWAVEAAKETDAYRGFRMGSFGPVVHRAEPLPSGAWNVTITDVAQRYEALHEPAWTPATPFEAWGYVAFVVSPGAGVEVTHRGW